MTLVVEVATRISSEVAALKDRVEYVAALAALAAEGAMPQREVAAFVVPMGFDSRGAQAVVGMYTQAIVDTVGVVLCVKAFGDASAKRALVTIDALVDDVTKAVAGWSPGATAGVFEATRGRLVSVTKGLVIYQLDFSLLDQLRIAR
jgi:hypothetical protein